MRARGAPALVRAERTGCAEDSWFFATRFALKGDTVMIVRANILAAIVVLCSCAVCLGGESRENGGMVLPIEWQRLMDRRGETCERCGGTEKELRKAFSMLKRSLRPLGFKVTLEKTSLGPECAKDIIDSNRITIAGRTLEHWLDAKVGSSACGSCCAKLGEMVECRTTTVDGETYEVIPAELIVKAGLKAASEAMGTPAKSSCCPTSKTPCTQSGTCCPK